MGQIFECVVVGRRGDLKKIRRGILSLNSKDASLNFGR